MSSIKLCFRMSNWFFLHIWGVATKYKPKVKKVGPKTKIVTVKL